MRAQSVAARELDWPRLGSPRAVMGNTEERAAPMTMAETGGAFVADTARVLGDVRLGANASVWYGAVIRGDVAPVVIGEGTNAICCRGMYIYVYIYIFVYQLFICMYI